MKAGKAMELDKSQIKAVSVSEPHGESPSAGVNYGRTAAAGYIEDMLREMEMIAAKHGIEPLRDLLRMAKEEARKVAGVG